MTPKIRVLFVDDDPAYRDLAAMMLEKVDSSIDVLTEGDPSNVPHRLTDESIDCVVSDYQMPGMDGLQLCERIREVHPEVPFFLFTSFEGGEVIEAALETGATDYIRKESGIEHFKLLANRVVKAVEHHRLRNQLTTQESEA